MLDVLRAIYTTIQVIIIYMSVNIYAYAKVVIDELTRFAGTSRDGAQMHGKLSVVGLDGTAFVMFIAMCWCGVGLDGRGRCV